MTRYNWVKKQSPAGFTLAEILIVLVFMSIVVMLGWPSLNAALGDFRLSGGAQETVNALEFAQLTATSGRKTRVTIDAVADTILVEQFNPVIDLLGGESELGEADVEGGAFAPMGNPMNKGTDYNISLPSEDRFDGVDITAVDFSHGNLVAFDALGCPSSGGTVTLALGSRQMVVTLDSLTGKVTVSN